MILRFFSTMARDADLLAFVINVLQAAFVDSLGGLAIVLGAIVAIADGPAPLMGGITIALTLDLSVSTFSLTGIAENVLGGVSLVATALADIAYGNTDLHNVGVDTLVSARSAVLGLAPEVNIDFLVSSYQLGYDSKREDGTLSGGSVPWSLDDISAVINFYWPEVDCDWWTGCK
jgi:hypothetical protein